MPATPSRIGFIQTEYRRVVSSTMLVKALHGNLARASDDPVETFFDDEDDAQAVADARQTLLSPDRRRLRMQVADLTDVLALDYIGAVPVATMVDRNRSIDGPALVSEITLDFARQGAVVTLWG